MVASVTIGEETKDSGIDGVVQFTRAYGDYEATISADGYTTVTEELAFRSNHKNFDIELEAASPTGTVTITLLAESDDSPISNTKVDIYEINQGPKLDTGTTDSNGQCTFNLENGTYDVYSEPDGYANIDESFTVTDNDKAFTFKAS